MRASAEGSEWAFPNRATPLGSPSYYAVRFSPAAERERSARLFAWYELVRQIARQPRDPGVARLKLDWWRAELQRMAEGGARHPLAREMLLHGLTTAALGPMAEIIDGAEAAIRAPRAADLEGFVELCRAGKGRFFVLLAAAADATGCERRSCLEAGAYCAALGYLRRAPEGQARLPPELAAHNLERLSAAQRAARIDAVLAQFATANAAAAGELPGAVSRLTAMARAVQQKMRRRGYPVHGAAIDRAPIAHLWTAWRCR